MPRQATLHCAACGMLIHLDTAPEGSPGVLWFLDARGHVLERGTMGEGHVQLTGDARLGSRPGTVHCAGPVLPMMVDLRDGIAAATAAPAADRHDDDAVLVIDLTDSADLSDLSDLRDLAMHLR